MGEEKHYPTDGRGQQDAGALEKSRLHPCTKRTWCVLNEEHVGSCQEVPRYHIELPDLGPPRRSK